MSSSDIHQLLLYFSGGWVNYGKRFILGDPLTNEAESRLYYIHVKGTSLCNNHHRWCLIFCRGTVRHVFSTVQWSWHFATVIYCMSLQRNPPPTTLVHYKWKWQPSFYIKVMNHLQMLITTQWTSPGFDSQYTLVTIKHMLPHNPNSLKCAIVLFFIFSVFCFLIHCSS